jgi:hypothetical protein
MRGMIGMGVAIMADKNIAALRGVSPYNADITRERFLFYKTWIKLADPYAEPRTFEEKIQHLIDQMFPIDLDDGMKHNDALFQDVLATIK